MAGGGLSDHSQRPVQIGAAQGIAVHGGGIKGGLGQPRDRRFQQGAAVSLVQRHGFRHRRRGQRQNPGQRLFD
ncbi:MAG: hypothetical protein AW09_004625 [Candidatus Accumulibacter phosphatis]|uniref:Uncharacterized protein n=1 Tax=Candidatus Accumulibacter phosphatis TaxID=327160 RepID=A0A084Y6E5_9PROT|nr:MAG: hypothetical protein AW09_004625 [Candidatus Accumulibacter phosphatis]